MAKSSIPLCASLAGSLLLPFACSGQPGPAAGHDAASPAIARPLHGPCVDWSLTGPPPVPNVLAAGRRGPLAIAADRASVYWTEDEAVMSVSVGGGAPIRLARAISSRAIAVDADNVYFADVTGVTSVTIGGGKPTMLFAGLTSAQGLAVDSRYVYWTDSAAGTVMRVPRTGGTATIVATGEHTAAGIAADGERVVWAVSQPGSIETVPLSGGLPVNLASAQSAPQQVALDPLNAYWTNSGGATPGSVLEVPLAGGPAITLATGQTDAVGIAAAPVQGAGTYVFWVNRAAGQLMAAPAIGGFPPIELASGLGRPERVAVGTDRLYWTDNSSGNVMELPCAREGEPRDAGSDAPLDGAPDAEPMDSSLDDATIEDEANDIPGFLNPPPPPPLPPFLSYMLCPVDAGAPLCNDLQPTCNGAPVIQQGEAGAPPASIWIGGPVVPGRYDLELDFFYPTTDDCKSPVSSIAATAEVTATSATSGSIQIAETTQTTGIYSRVTSDTVTESYTTSGTTITETVSCGPTQSGPMTGIYAASSAALVIQNSVTLVGADGGPCSVYEARIYSISADDAGTPDAATPVDAEVAGNAE